jgi:hypothetical protein
MSKFLTPLELSLMTKANGIPLTNRSGRQLYQLCSAFVYQSDVADDSFIVPKGFVTDLASIPRLPFCYLLLNGIADGPGVIHDYLYSNDTIAISRDLADSVLKEACLLIGVSWWKAQMIYLGVRVGGASHFKAH